MCYTAVLAGSARIMLPPGEYIRNYTDDAHCRFVAYFGVFFANFAKIKK